MSKMFIEMYPELGQYLGTNEKLVFKLRKYLYGLPQAAFYFHQHLSARMKELGFAQLTSDRCLWRRGTGDMRIYVCAHVDDLTGIGKSAALSKFEKNNERAYDITVQKGFKRSYIGLVITQLRDSKKVVVSQK